jgi:hypothetical protein
MLQCEVWHVVRPTLDLNCCLDARDTTDREHTAHVDSTVAGAPCHFDVLEADLFKELAN